MDFPCEDASVEYQSWCFVIFPSPSSTLEKCGLKVDKHVKTNAKFTSPHVFLWEKHGGGGGGRRVVCMIWITKETL